jgi:hypothetical protein
MKVNLCPSPSKRQAGSERVGNGLAGTRGNSVLERVEDAPNCVSSLRDSAWLERGRLEVNALTLIRASIDASPGVCCKDVHPV